MHSIVEAVNDVTGHDAVPTLTAGSPPSRSNPAPLRLSFLPPPTDPATGATAVISARYVKVNVKVWLSDAFPSAGRATATVAAPRGAGPTVQLSLVVEAEREVALTDVHAVPPSLTAAARSVALAVTRA